MNARERIETALALCKKAGVEPKGLSAGSTRSAGSQLTLRAAGVLADMRDGKSVIYFGSRAAGTELLADCVAMAGADEVARVARANGKERVDHRTGGMGGMSEPLPEYVHQTLPIYRLKKAIEQIEMAERQDDPQVKLELLRAADESCMYARRSAESLMAMWRGLNERAEELQRRLDDEARAGRPGQDSLFEEAS